MKISIPLLFVLLLLISESIHDSEFIPKIRKAHSFTAKKFLNITSSLSRRNREHMAIEQIYKGHVPTFLYDLKEIKIMERDHTLTIWSTLDYVSVGNDSDYLIYPLNLPNALSLAENLGMILPTTKLVDIIYAHADRKLKPQPLPASITMSTNKYIYRHQKMFEKTASMKRPSLVAGHKKDVVLTRRLLKYPHQLAIYGWHRKNYTPIQPLSLYHGANYSDYSHGIRLISRYALLDGKPIDIKDVLADPKLSYLISYEGPIHLDQIIGNYNLSQLDKAAKEPVQEANIHLK